MAYTEKSFPWDDVSGDRTYNADNYAEYFSILFAPGIVASANLGNGLQIKESASLGMRIKFGSGAAWSTFGRGYIHTQDEEISVPVASSLQDRTDSISIQFNKSTRSANMVYKQGDESVTRTDTLYELQIAKVKVGKNVTQITNADITDMRSNTTVCGYCTPYGDANVGDITAQFNAEFQTWFNSMKDQLSTDAAGNLQNQIDSINNIIVQKEIPDGANLDDYINEGEFSKKESTVVTGAPDGVTGALRLSVRKMMGSSGFFQTLYDYATCSMYHRTGDITLGFNLPWQKVVTNVDDVPWTNLTPGTGVLVPSGAYLKYRIKNGFITIVASDVQTTIDSNGQKTLTTLPISIFDSRTSIATIFTGNTADPWRARINGNILEVAGNSGIRSNYVSFSATLPIN